MKWATTSAWIRTKDGRELDEALQDNANAMEEMKADLVSLFVAEALHKQGYYTDAQLRSVYAGGILRVLQNNRPRRDQPYNTMQLMQWNFYLENGLLSFDPATKTMRSIMKSITTLSARCSRRRSRCSTKAIRRRLIGLSISTRSGTRTCTASSPRTSAPSSDLASGIQVRRVGGIIGDSGNRIKSGRIPPLSHTEGASPSS